jgi:hypothetical protein
MRQQQPASEAADLEFQDQLLAKLGELKGVALPPLSFLRLMSRVPFCVTFGFRKTSSARTKARRRSLGASGHWRYSHQKNAPSTPGDVR